MSKSSVGVFPTSFPRDPIDVNAYLEHVLLGQILEPLVLCGQDGSLEPGAAEKWEISTDGLTIKFFIDQRKKFSNGRQVTARDALYTLKRHKDSKNSQSKSYLSRVVEMTAPSESLLILKLDKPYVAQLKALSRDQLGIVPEGWVFDKNSSEPFTGSGSYRAIREGETWKLTKNTHFHFQNREAIDEWEVIQLPSTATDIPKIPEFIPFIFDDTKKMVTQSKNWLSEQHKFEKVLHFFQSSGWWYPHGRRFKDAHVQKIGMCALDDLFARVVESLKLERVTGLIPEGIAGYTRRRDLIPCAKPVGGKGKGALTFDVAILTRELHTLNQPEIILAVEKDHGVKFNFIRIDPPQFAELPTTKPDILVLAFAGGFHDPEGFLTVITAMLKSDLPTIMESHFKSYEKASSETDWNKRDHLYQSLNEALVESFRLAPGWKVHAERVRRLNLQPVGGEDLRYSPKFYDYRLRKENE